MYKEHIMQKVVEARKKKALQKAGCEHDWQTFKETLMADNPKFKGQAHFIIQGCMKCKEKRRTDYIVQS